MMNIGAHSAPKVLMLKAVDPRTSVKPFSAWAIQDRTPITTRHMASNVSAACLCALS